MIEKHPASSTIRDLAAERCSPAKRIPASAVRKLCGGVSDMTLWRWLGSPEMDFPRPIYIGRRRYWREADVIAWLDAQSAQTAAE